VKRILTTYSGWTIFFILSCLPQFASAGDKLEGYYTVEEVRTFNPLDWRDKIVIRKTWYTPDRILKDEDYLGKTIARFDLGKIFYLDHFEKTYMTLPSDLLRENARRSFGAFGLQDENGGIYFPDDLFIRTESTKEIGPWQCYQVVTNPKYRSPKENYAVFWYSTDVDFPVDLYVNKMTQLFGNAPEVVAFFDNLKKFEGYPVRTEAHGALNTFTTLIKVEYQTDIDAQLFEIPEGYTEVPVPEEDSGLFGDK